MSKSIKSFFVLLVLMMPTGLAQAQISLRVMTLNAEWFWTPHDGRADGTKLDRKDPSPSEYAAERDFYVQLIRQHQVNLLALSEIEHGGVAEDIAKLLGSSWRSHFIQGRDTATGQDVAILSSFSVVPGSETTLGFPEGRLPGEKKGKRLSKFLALRLDVGGQQVSILTAHLLSRRDNDRNKTLDRQRQAYAVHDALNQMRQVAPHIIMLGDFNSPQKTEEFSILTDHGRLQVAEVDCHAMTSKKLRSSVDQIFYSGFRCSDYQRIDLKQFSDHEAIIATLEFSDQVNPPSKTWMP